MTESVSIAARPRFTGLKVLVVEDEIAVSLQLEDMLKALGCSTIWHAKDVTAALSILCDHKPDAAVLDVYLAGELAYPIARWLDAQRIPFVFTKGYGRRGILGHWAAKPAIQKPLTVEALRAKLELALALTE